ncbi:T9SS type B sorting domain-containing protein [Aequorivita sp. H23M31]|uniref:T9SS type B sorting domain-containing protein n=2 Tax=Aequorivita ciconiae TaxID=2494375 RepID=A0A410G3D4_9FLAO|nr:T9SS type B sorting domain-containing protein [Aequorivita sp. H23M31]
MKRLLLSFLLLIPFYVFSQQVVPVDQYMQFNGRYDFTAFGNTLNTEENGGFGACTIMTSSSANFQLDPGQTLLSAHLYWAGSGGGDFNVKLNGTPITAQRTFALTSTSGLNYFSAYADVTNILAFQGQGTYTLSDLDLTNVIGPYCPGGTNFGGWAIIVIYEDPSLLLNQITLFDGLDYVDANHQNINIVLDNISAATDVAAKIGFLAWEGDAAIAVNESLRLNGILIDNPPLNPGNNAFNSTNSYTNSFDLYNMDLDYYDLQGLNIIQPGDDQINIQLSSGQDFIMVNNIIVSVNSELPDATITIDNLGVLCEDRNIEVHYTVANFNSTAVLPANTPIAFYAGTVLLGQTQTVNEIPIEGTESGTINLNIPIGTPQVFTLKAVVDDDGTGNGIVVETNENNNEFEQEIDLSAQGLFVLGNNESCEGMTETLTANFLDLDVYNWFFNGNPYGGNSSSIEVTQSGIYTVSGNKAACYVLESAAFVVTFNPQPVANEPIDLFRCDNGVQSGIFDLTQNDANILGGQDPTLFDIKYFTTVLDSENNTNEITNPGAYPIVGPTPQTIYVRIHDSAQEMCYALEQFQIYYTPVNAGVVPPFTTCDQDQSDGEDINLPLRFNLPVLGTQNAADYNITYHATQADADAGINDLPAIYSVPVPGQTIFIRIEPVIDGDCYDTTTVDIIIDSPPLVNTTPEPLILCDSDNDGYAPFTLHNADDDITMGDATLVVTYHPTQLDADNNLNELSDPYVNDDPFNDVVFARIEGTETTCYSTVRLELVVRNSPTLTVPTPLRLCDDDTDGLQIFDLTVKEPEMLGGMDPAQYDLYYYETEADAVAAGDLALTAPDFSGAIVTPAAYQNTVPFHQTVYVLAVGNALNTSPHNGGEGCYDIVPLELFVDPLPVPIQPLPYELCDDLASGSDSDQISTFDLTTRNREITGGDLSLSVTWFETYADEAMDNPIPNPRAYQNREIPPAPLNPMTIVARVTNNFGCSATITLTLVVNPLPVPAVPTPLEVCDGDNNGFAEFDLTEKDIEITNGEQDVTIRYYTTRALAEIGSLLDQIFSPYTNDNPFFDTVWARVERTTTGCYAVVPLQLIVNPVPGAPAPGFGNLFACDAEDGSGAEFDLTENTEFVYGDQSPDFLISFYTSLDDALVPTNAIGSPTAYTSTGQTIWVRLEDNETGCFRISSFELVVSGLPALVPPADMELCDDLASGSDTDGVSVFNLNSNNSTITGGNLSLTVRYYETVADQQNDIPVPNPTTYSNPVDANGDGITPHTLQVSVFNTDGCASKTTLTLVVLPVPRAITPTPLVVCDDDNDGFAEFDLTLKDDEIANAEPGLAIQYYTTRILAELGDPLTQITGPYTNDTPFFDTVWARVEKTATGCHVIRELELWVSPVPDAPTEGFGDLLACDLDGGTSAEFDLTENAPFIYGTQSPDLILTYHTALDDALVPTNAITDPTSFTSSGQTIWVRLENDVTGCFRISSFELVVGGFPAITPPADMVLCDDLESGSDTDGISIFDLTANNNTITGGNAALTVRYYESIADQQDDNPIADPSAYANPVDGAGQGISPYTLQVTVSSAAGCSATTTLTLVVLPVPRAGEPDPLVKCDDDNDGFARFDLALRDAQISNGNPAVVVTYHETLLDAQNGTLPLASPFQNIVAFSQTIYARATFALAPNTSGCYSIVPLELIVSPSPVVPVDLPDLVACDPDGDGTAVFDLTVQEDLIYGGQDRTVLRLTYHTTQGGADTGDDPIVNPGAYTNTSNPQEIYVRLAYTEGDLCFATGHFALVVSDGIPINEPGPLEICDDLGEPNDMRAVFDLTVKNAEITGGAPGLGVGYFLTEADALANVDRIDPDHAFENTENPQRVYVRVEDGNSGCVSYTHLLLRVLPNPQPATPEPLVLCDENIVVGPGPDDGVELFDLTLRAAAILHGETWELGYFESYGDAVGGDPATAVPDPTSYANTSSPQTIYVRATNAATGCFEIVELELIVYPLPDDSAPVSNYMQCLSGTDLALFDLTTKIDEILGPGQSQLDFEVTFYLDPVFAETGTNRILNPGQHWNRDLMGNTENPQTIYTGIRDRVTGCYIGGLQHFELIVQEGAEATEPAEPFAICDNLPPSDGFAEFDLEDFSIQKVVDLRNGILGGQDPLVYSLAYYETLEEAEAGTDPIVFPFVNTINPQVVYARVTNEENLYEPQCHAIVEVILKVHELPLIVLEEQYTLCVDANGNPIGPALVIDTGLDPELYSFEWMLDGVLLPGEDGPSTVAVVDGTYTVIVTALATGCDASASTEVVLSSPPFTYGASVTTMPFADSHSIEVWATGLGIYEYQLDDGPFQDGTIFENVAAGPHTITIRDKNGCGLVTITIGVLDYMPYFTPNGDGYHDTWNIIGMAQADPSAKIYIFDRYGKLLKQVSPLGPGWDGTYNGNPLPSSDYWFRVEYVLDGTPYQFKGHFALKR